MLAMYACRLSPSAGTATVLPLRSRTERTLSVPNSSKHPTCTPESRTRGSPASMRITPASAVARPRSTSPEAHRRLRVVVPPARVGQLPHQLERGVLAPRVASVHERSHRPLRVGRADLVRLEDGSKGALRGHGVLAHELAAAGQNAAEVLGPWLVAERVDEDVPSLARQQLRGFRCKAHERI